MIKEYIVELREEEAEELMDEHWVGELVRCKNCKYWQSTISKIIDGEECHPCNMEDGYNPPDWYCPYGKRRDDDG